jgi:PAS domain S-box-containing protein
VLTTISSGESELSKRIWDKVLLENTDDVVHVLSLKGLFLYLSPSSRKVLEYDSSELVGTALSSVCHPSDIVPVTRELKDTSTGAAVNVVFRIRRKHSGYTWFESHGSLHTEQGKGRKCIILVGRERPVYALSRHDMELSGGISDSELWSKMSTSGMFLFVSSNSRSLLDRQPEELVGTSIQALMRPESKPEFGRMLEQVRSGKRAQFKHEMQNKRGQTLQAHSTIYPGDAGEGQKPTFLVAQTKLLRPTRAGSSSAMKPGTPLRLENTPASSTPTQNSGLSSSLSQARGISTPQTWASNSAQSVARSSNIYEPITSQAGGAGLPIGSQDVALASDLNVFDELKTTRSTSWQFELRQMEKKNRILKEELDSLQSARRKRKRRKGPGHVQKECANCHTKSSPEWRRGPSGNRDLCNSCGLRWTKQVCFSSLDVCQLLMSSVITARSNLPSFSTKWWKYFLSATQPITRRRRHWQRQYNGQEVEYNDAEAQKG